MYVQIIHPYFRHLLDLPITSTKGNTFKKDISRLSISDCLYLSTLKCNIDKWTYNEVIHHLVTLKNNATKNETEICDSEVYKTTIAKKVEWFLIKNLRVQPRKQKTKRKTKQKKKFKCFNYGNKSTLKINREEVE